MKHNMQMDLATDARKAFIKSVDASKSGYVFLFVLGFVATFSLFARGGL